jgi:GNAT superfamily N-acetyltransferase
MNNDKKINLNNIKICKLKDDMLKGLNFDCGDEELNEFLFDNSIDHMKSEISIVYLLKYKKEIVGYFALSTDSIKITKGDRKKIKEIYGISYPYYPAIKVGRLAIDKNYKRNGIGTMIIDYVMGLVSKLRSDVGIRYLAVDSYSESQKFYENNDFKLFKLKEKKNIIQMYLEIKN